MGEIYNAYKLLNSISIFWFVGAVEIVRKTKYRLPNIATYKIKHQLSVRKMRSIDTNSFVCLFEAIITFK